jgi:5-oxopent-3-ene-1,2,5-tricarboxylate decarboxylase/2-hydroxyhepta-2,4-diene-1,7-dioate isomerase
VAAVAGGPPVNLAIDGALVRLGEDTLARDVAVDPGAQTLSWDGRTRSVASLSWQPPVAGAVYGALFNDAPALAALGDAVHAPPYRAPPRAPVLYVKPRNTHSAHGWPIVVPAGVPELAMGACLGVVIGRTACRVRAGDALSYVAGYTVANDVCVPHADFHRPMVRHRCRDGFCPLGPWVLARRHVADPDALELRVEIDGVVRQRAGTRTHIRSVAQLLADVTDFMTLVAGDVLLTGVPAGAPLARPGQHVAITIEGVGTLANPVVGEVAR